jgi:hypothetical protein
MRSSSRCARESADTDRFSTSALCHELLHPIALNLAARHLDNLGGTDILSLRNRDQTPLRANEDGNIKIDNAI